MVGVSGHYYSTTTFSKQESKLLIRNVIALVAKLVVFIRTESITHLYLKKRGIGSGREERWRKRGEDGGREVRTEGGRRGRRQRPEACVISLSGRLCTLVVLLR